MKNGIFAMLALACLGFPATQGLAAENGGWQYEATPYLFASGLDGTVGVSGFTTEVDASFSDILENLDGGFMGLFTARRGPWLFALEGVYMRLESEQSRTVTGPGGLVSVNGQLDVTNKLYVVQGSAGYRVLDGRTKVDLLGAARWTKLDADLSVQVQFTPGIVFPGGSLSANGNESWTDFVVGAQVTHPISDTVALYGYADVGAGGSDMSYQLVGGVNWEFARNFTAKAGYRHLYWDYEDDGVVWDMAANGLYLGLGIRF
jgi:hypothetical protein